MKVYLNDEKTPVDSMIFCEDKNETYYGIHLRQGRKCLKYRLVRQ
jgi:hypothetical protein